MVSLGGERDERGKRDERDKRNERDKKMMRNDYRDDERERQER
jgi:hypothetical protein